MEWWQDMSRREPRKYDSPRKMVLWSGGVESTSLLYHMLSSEPETLVFAHHVQLVTSEQRHYAEDRAIGQLMSKLRRVRQFHYSSSRLELVGGHAVGWDFMQVYTIGLAAMRHFACHSLYRGFCLEDDYHRVGTNYASVNKASGEHRHHVQSVILRPQLILNEALDTVVPFHPMYAWSKARHWALLGDLAELTWSCRKPVHNMGADFRPPDPCGKCHACADRFAAEQGTSSIPDIAEELRRA